MSSYKNFEEEEEYVRPPDQVIRERLIGSEDQDLYWETKKNRNPPYFSRDEDLDLDLDIDLKSVLEESMLEYTVAEIQKKEEEECEIQKSIRATNLEEFVRKLNSLATIDNVAFEVKTVIQEYITKYVNEGTTNGKKTWDSSTEKLVNSYLRTMRIKMSEKELLKNILSMDF